MGRYETAKWQEDSSFCGQKEAKKLYSLALGKTTDAEIMAWGRRISQNDDGRRIYEVFLLLFVHKKKDFFCCDCLGDVKCWGDLLPEP